MSYSTIINELVCYKEVYAAELIVLIYISGIQRAQPTGESTHGTATVKPQWCGFRAPQTTTRPPLMGPPPTPASRLPRKVLGPARSLNEASVNSELSHSTGNTQGEPHRKYF